MELFHTSSYTIFSMKIKSVRLQDLQINLSFGRHLYWEKDVSIINYP